MPYVMSPSNCPLLTALTTLASLLYPEHAWHTPASVGCVSCISSWLAPLLHSETLLIGSLLPPSFQNNSPVILHPWGPACFPTSQ